MGLKSWFIKVFSKKVAEDIQKWSRSAVVDQLSIMHSLLNKAKGTQFGKDHNFGGIANYQEFISNIPLRDYESLRPYMDRMVAGEADVLWPGRPKYLAKTSGTTSGVKYIPLTCDSMPNHINSARNALLNYIHKSGNHAIFNGKLIFLSGSPELNYSNDIPTGRLSGIVNHEVPSWVKGNQLPSYKTNCIAEWEEKLEQIIEETLPEDMRLISGIPPWVQMYYERLLQTTGQQTIKDVFPNFSLFMYGGVNFEPYRDSLEKLVGKRIDSIETYPASEGFIAFQDLLDSKGLLLNTNSGIFFEFVPVSEIHDDNPSRYHLGDIELDMDYALIINNNAGLWGYNIGDMVRFTSKDPYRIIVSGRVKHFISAFGEHVIGKEVEEAMMNATSLFHVSINEFTVAPQVNPPEGGEPYHEWFIEFSSMPDDVNQFAKELDAEMCRQNIYYDDLIRGNILRSLVVRPLKPKAFRAYMKSLGKLGGQNKVPRLSNDRTIVDNLKSYIL